MDFGEFIKTYGALGAVILFGLWELWKFLRDRNTTQNKRDLDQDARDSNLSKSFGKLIEVFQQTSQSTAAANERAAAVFDKVTLRLDDNTKLISEQFKLASEQRAEQLILTKAMIGQLANPEPRFVKVVEDINGPIIKVVEDRAMDVTKKIIEELQQGLRELSAALIKLQGGQDDIKAENIAILAKIEVLKQLVDTLQPTPPVTVNVTTPIPPIVTTDIERKE